MLKALLKKQFLETASFFFLDRKKGARRNIYQTLGVCALIIYAVGAFGFTIWQLCDMLCAPLVANGLAWVYFAFVGIYGTGIACIGSVFAAKSKLFESKDNEALLSLPIPTWMILFSRMITLYLLTLALFALMLVPAFALYFTVAPFSVSVLIGGFGILLFTPLAVLAICSLLGWAIAFLTARLPHKNAFTLIAFAAFMVAYFIFVDKVNEYLVYVIANGEQFGASIKNSLYPFYKMGLAATGDLLSLLVLIGICVVLFAIVYFLLQKTFVAVATVKRGERKKKYRFKQSVGVSVNFTLLKKELLRLFKNPMIFLNAGMGTVLSIIVAIVAPFEWETLYSLTQAIEQEEIVAIVAVLLCFIASSNVFSASSVSLEGESLWIVRSSPIPTSAILKSKIFSHLLLSCVPTAIAGIVVCVCLKISWYVCVLMLLVSCAIATASACVGLAINLCMPNLHWTNEIAAVKQSFSVILTMFAGWGASALVLGLRFLTDSFLPVWALLLLVSVLFATATCCVGICLKKRGESKFENL